MNCKNCNETLEANYCSNCGQSANVGRFNYVNILGEISGSIFQLNRGVLFTAKELFLRPGHSIREYLQGKRKNHFKPLAYTFTLSTILFFTSRYLGSETQITDFIEGFTGYEDDFKMNPNVVARLEWLAKNYSYSILMFLPFNSMASFLAFYGTGYNYLEHVILNAYITGQQALIYLFFSFLILMIPDQDIIGSLSFLSSIGFTFIVFWQFFSKSKKPSIFFRTVLSYLLIFTFLLIGIIFLFLIAT